MKLFFSYLILIGFTNWTLNGQNIDKQSLAFNHQINLSIQIAQNTINPIFEFDFPPVWKPTFTVFNYLSYAPFDIAALLTDTHHPPNLILPDYTQGKFCDFEDYINRKRKMRIDFSVK